MLGQTVAFTTVHPLNSFFFSSPKTLYFSCNPPNMSHQNNDLRLIHRWIIMKFRSMVQHSFPSIMTVANFEIMSGLREIPFAS